MSRGYANSEVGRRSRNEDSFCVRPELGLYVVADGMGGQFGGAVASKTVVDTLEGFFERMGAADTEFASKVRETPELVQQRLSLAVRMCQKEVARRSVGELDSMGSTVAAVLVRGEHAVIAHVGDSRVYRLRRGRLELLTRDHSLIAELEAAGGSHLAKKLSGPWTSMITRSISARSNAQPDLRIEDVQPGDRYMICSDGLFEALSDAQIQSVLVSYEGNEASAQLVARAYRAGSGDNITVVVVDTAPAG